MSNVLEEMKTRRSIRKFKPDAIPQEILDQIIEAGTYAANGRGAQNVIIIQVTNKEKRDEIAKKNASSNPNYLLPIIALAAYPMAYITRLTKTSMLDALNQDYIRTARAKGVHRLKVIFKHALKNALIPVVTYVGPMVAYILTGSMVVENIFTIGGLGTEFVTSIVNRDYTMIMAITIFLAVLMVVANLLTDIAYKLIDPRITFE